MISYQWACQKLDERRTIQTVPQVYYLTSCYGHAPQVSLEELESEPLILLDLPPAGDNTLRLLHERGLRPYVIHRSTSYETVHSMVARGLDTHYFPTDQDQSLYEGCPCRVQSTTTAGRTGCPVMADRCSTDAEPTPSARSSEHGCKPWAYSSAQQWLYILLRQSTLGGGTMIT